MSWTKRPLKSTRTNPSVIPSPPATAQSPITFNLPTLSSSSHEPIHTIPPNTKLPGLTTTSLSLLRKKQRQLGSNASSLLASLEPNPHILNALNSPLIFAQHEAGTAVCIEAAGWLLTCSHCFAESLEEWEACNDEEKRKWLLYYDGTAVRAECRVWDGGRDLALLKIVAIEHVPPIDEQIPSFAFVSLPLMAPKAGEGIVCIG